MKRKSKWLPFRPALGAGILLAVVVCCKTTEASLAECIDATCRISTPDGGRGTGCAFENSRGHLFVLTAAHVVGRHRFVQCEFWREGHRSVPLAAEVIVRSEVADAAVVCLPIDSLGGVVPAYIPIAPRGFRLSQGETVASVGCAKGAWATGWKGHVVGYSGSSLCFTPAPADGRSGSALFDAAGENIVGLIWGRSDSEGKGYAVTVENLYRALNFKRTAAGWIHASLPLLDVADNVQRGDNVQCGPQGCSPQGYLLPYRNYQQQREDQRDRQLDQFDRRLQPGQGIWPTLPPQTQRLQGKIEYLSETPGQKVPEKAEQDSPGRASGLGVALALAAALGVGIFLFYVVGKQ